MEQLPQEIWNEIADTGLLQSKWGKKMFRMNEQEIYPELEKQAKDLIKLGYNNRTVLSYLTVKPLLLERKAIQVYVETHPNMIKALPEVLDSHEAVLLMKMEYRLDKKECSDLFMLLNEPEKSFKN